MNYCLTIFKLQLRLIFELHKRASKGANGYLKNKFFALFLLQKIFLIIFCISKILLFLIAFIAIFCFYHISLIGNIHKKNKKSGFIDFARKNRVFFSLTLWHLLYGISLSLFLFADLMVSFVICWF